MSTNSPDLQEFAKQFAQTQQANRDRYVSSVRFTPLNVPTPVPEKAVPNDQAKNETPAIALHEMPGGTKIYQIEFGPETPSEFTLNTDVPSLPHLFQGKRAEGKENWSVTDFIVNPDLQPKNEMQHVCRVSELPDDLQTLLPGASADDGVNFKVDGIDAGGVKAEIFLARTYDATKASMDAPLKSAYFYIARRNS